MTVSSNLPALKTAAAAPNNSGEAGSKRPPRSSLVSRNITVNNHRTSVRLEPDMWNALREICRREHATLHDLCSTIAAHKSANTSLTAAIRVFIMAYFRAASTEDGHSKAGHGPGGYFMAAHKQDQSQGLVPSSLNSHPPGRESPHFLMR